MSPRVLGVIVQQAIAPSDLLTAAVDEALERVEGHMDGPLVLLASLTEAVERLVVRRAFERLRVGTLVTPLPFERRIIERELDAPGPLGEFRSLVARARYVMPVHPPHGASRREACELAGRFIVDRAQVLLVVGGATATSSDDPTPELTVLARRCEVKMVWVHADGPDAGPGARTGPRSQG